MELSKAFDFCERRRLVEVHLNTIYIKIGDIAVSGEPCVINTILGSCVSVCLYSLQKQLGGMIHYALPSKDLGRDLINDPSDLDSELRYGDFAIPELIKRVSEAARCSSQELQAKVVGGAIVTHELTEFASIGRLNIELAFKLLQEAKIPVLASDVGGRVGRKVLFYPQTGRLRVAPVSKQNPA
jgi:chemotaxis protein CheD